MEASTGRARSVFGNGQGEATYQKAVQSKERFLCRFGDDSNTVYHLSAALTPVIGELLGVRNLVISPNGEPLDICADASGAPQPPSTERTVDGTNGAPIIVGNIRMGFGHYRISMAMASAAHAMGHTPYWPDLASFREATGSKAIRYQNDLYSKGPRISQRVGRSTSWCGNPSTPRVFASSLTTPQTRRTPSSAYRSSTTSRRTSLRGNPRLACPGSRACRHDPCGERNPRQLAHGAAPIGGCHPHGPDAQCLPGVHAFCDKDIFAAVYSSNLLMRCSDVLVTKPSEFSFYPVPKLMIHRVGGHEAWGAIRAAEVGDGTYEMDETDEVLSMIDSFQRERGLIGFMCDRIEDAAKAGIYDGAYRVIDLAVNGAPTLPAPGVAAR